MLVSCSAGVVNGMDREMRVVLVCGDREWTDITPISRELLRVRPDLIVHGGARGVDTLAGTAARIMEVPVVVYPAQWELFGKRAGPLRNQKMLDEAMPTLVLAFHKNINASKGTKDMVRRAEKAGIPFQIWEG